MANQDYLKAYAAPFDVNLRVAMDGGQTVSIRHSVYGFANKDIPSSEIMAYKGTSVIPMICKAIDELKKEVGYNPIGTLVPTGTVVTPLEPTEEELAEKILAFSPKEPPKDKKHPECPTHGNLLVPSKEVGVLQCPVPGCKRKARKKSVGTSPTPAAPPPEAPSTMAPDPLAELAEQSPRIVPDFVNDDKPRVRNTMVDGKPRVYLVQRLPDGRGDVAIDVTSLWDGAYKQGTITLTL